LNHNKGNAFLMPVIAAFGEQALNQDR